MEKLTEADHNVLSRHPVHLLLGSVVDESGMGVNLAVYEDANNFKEYVSTGFLSKVTALIIRCGPYLLPWAQPVFGKSPGTGTAYTSHFSKNPADTGLLTYLSG